MTNAENQHKKPDASDTGANTQEKSQAEQSPSAQSVSSKSTSSANRKSQRKIHRSQPSETVKSRRRTNPLIAVLVFLNTMALVAVAAAGYWGWQQWQHWQEQQQETQSLQLQTQQQALDNQLDSELARLQTEIQQEMARAAVSVNTTEQQLVTAFSALRDSVEEQLANTEQDLDLVEIEYLLRMAARKVNVEKQVKPAVVLLQEADALLARKGDENLLPLRERIATDIRKVRELQLDTTTHSALLIGALFNQLDSLTYPQPKQHFAKNHEEPSENPEDWWQNLKLIGQKIIDNFLNFEKLDEPITPYLNTQQQLLLKNVVGYHLLTLRHALLNRNQLLYTQTLEQVESAIQQFEQGNAATRLFQQDIESLKQQPFPQPIEVSLLSLDYFSSMLVAE